MRNGCRTKIVLFSSVYLTLPQESMISQRQGCCIDILFKFQTTLDFVGKSLSKWVVINMYQCMLFVRGFGGRELGQHKVCGQWDLGEVGEYVYWSEWGLIKGSCINKWFFLLLASTYLLKVVLTAHRHKHASRKNLKPLEAMIYPSNLYHD